LPPNTSPLLTAPRGCPPARHPQRVHPSRIWPAAVSPSRWHPCACLHPCHPPGAPAPVTPQGPGPWWWWLLPPPLVPPNLPSTPGRLGAARTAGTRLGKAGPAGTAVAERVGTGGVGEGERRPPGTRWVAAGAVGAFWHPAHPSASPQSSAPPTRARCRTPSCWRRVRGLQGRHRGAPRVSPPSQPCISPAEETRPPGPAMPRGSPSPEEPPEVEGSGTPPAPPNPWRETSLDRPYEKAKKPGVDPQDGETRGSRCYPGSPLAITATPLAPSSPDPAALPAPRSGDVPPYRFVPIRTLVLCRQAGSSAPSTPEPSGRRGHSQSLR